MTSRSYFLIMRHPAVVRIGLPGGELTVYLRPLTPAVVDEVRSLFERHAPDEFPVFTPAPHIVPPLSGSMPAP